MKKRLLTILLAIFVIIELVLVIFTYFNKKGLAKEVTKILEIEDTNQFFVEKIIYDGAGPGSEVFVCIKFKISISDYEKNNLKYITVETEEGIEEGEVTNKKVKVSDKYYMCYYEKLLYSSEEKDRFKELKQHNSGNLLEMALIANTLVIIILIVILIRKRNM